MKRLLFFIILLSVSLSAQEHVWRYLNPEHSSERQYWGGRLAASDSSCLYFDFADTDSIISKEIRIGRWTGNQTIHSRLETLSGTLNVKFKVEIWNGYKWIEPKQDISWRSFGSDSSGTSTIVGTSIAAASDSTDLFFTTAELLNDSNWGWADTIFGIIRITALFTGAQEGYLYQYIYPWKERN